MTSSTTFRRLTGFLAILFALSGAALLWHDACDGAALSPFMYGWTLWLASPYAVLVAAAYLGRSTAVIRGALALMLLAGAYGTLAYADLTYHFMSKSDAQDAIAMFFIPASQHIVVVPSLALLFALGTWLERRGKNTGRSAA